MMLKELEKDILKLQDKEKAKILARFFKTGRGEYGEGDKFIGITVPKQRKIAAKYRSLPLDETERLLTSETHEFRLTALLILVHKYNKADKQSKKQISDFYLNNTKHINNWDLVDLSSHKILGDYLIDKDRKILYQLATSRNLWEKRISIITTFAFIRKNQFNDTIRISEILLNDKHDLIQKAVGWMLREVGKRDENMLKQFLNKHYKKMPRTMLRYAIERFDENKKKFYMQK